MKVYVCFSTIYGDIYGRDFPVLVKVVKDKESTDAFVASPPSHGWTKHHYTIKELE